jgi:mannose-6-phosphate isomerase-like protein (cupin superfamily)
LTPFVAFAPPAEAGFRLVAGRPDGLQRLMVVSGRLLASESAGPVHAHAGDEVIRVLEGELLVRVGEERRTCRPGDLAIVPPRVLHGFRVVRDAVVEVVAEHDMGTLFPVRQPDGSRHLVEVYRTDLPWSAPPPHPGRYTTDDELAAILRSVNLEV